MNTIAPNLTDLVGKLVGARIIAQGGSLVNLAKRPCGTVSDKALFRALKTNSATPKYGLDYHALLIGQAAFKHKGLSPVAWGFIMRFQVQGEGKYRNPIVKLAMRHATCIEDATIIASRRVGLYGKDPEK